VSKRSIFEDAATFLDAVYLEKDDQKRAYKLAARLEKQGKVYAGLVDACQAAVAQLSEVLEGNNWDNVEDNCRWTLDTLRGALKKAAR
jgi:predicted nucleic acid-binding protein